MAAGEQPVVAEVVAAGADPAVEALVEGRDAVEVGPVRLAVVGVAADVVAEEQETADDVVELGGAQRDVLGLARRRPSAVQAPAKQSAWVSSWMLRPLAAKPNRPCMACPNSWAMTTGPRKRP